MVVVQAAVAVGCSIRRGEESASRLFVSHYAQCTSPQLQGCDPLPKDPASLLTRALIAEYLRSAGLLSTLAVFTAEVGANPLELERHSSSLAANHIASRSTSAAMQFGTNANPDPVNRVGAVVAKDITRELLDIVSKEAAETLLGRRPWHTSEAAGPAGQDANETDADADERGSAFGDHHHSTGTSFGAAREPSASDRYVAAGASSHADASFTAESGERIECGVAMEAVRRRRYPGFLSRSVVADQLGIAIANDEDDAGGGDGRFSAASGANGALLQFPAPDAGLDGHHTPLLLRLVDTTRHKREAEVAAASSWLSSLLPSGHRLIEHQLATRTGIGAAGAANGPAPSTLSAGIPVSGSAPRLSAALSSPSASALPQPLPGRPLEPEIDNRVLPGSGPLPVNPSPQPPAAAYHQQQQMQKPHHQLQSLLYGGVVSSSTPTGAFTIIP